MIPLWQTSAISSINWKRRILTHIRTMAAKRSFIGPHMKHSPLRDGHTQIHYPETQGSFSLVPIRFKAVGDGLYVRRLPDEHQQLIGSRLVGIENVQTKDLCEEMMKIYPAENEIGKLANICGHGHQPVVLGRIIPGLRQDTITYHLMTPEGNTVCLPLPLISVEQWKEWNNGQMVQENRFPTENLTYTFTDKQKYTMYFRSTSIMAREWLVTI